MEVLPAAMAGSVGPWPRRLKFWIVPVAAIAWCAPMAIGWLRFVYLSDFFPLVWLADAQRAGMASAFASGNNGWAYPALLNLVSAVTGNMLTSAKLLQLAAGAATLALVPAALRALFGDDRGAFLTQLLLAVDAVFVFAMASDTPDPIVTALFLAAFLTVARLLDEPRWILALLAGVWLGIAYNVRYHPVVVLVVLTAVAAVPRRTRRLALLVPAGFVLGALPQFVFSALAHGTPFYSTRVQALSLSYYGGFATMTGDFVGETASYTLWSLIARDPLHFVKTYLTFVAQYADRLNVVAFLLAGALLCLRSEIRGWLFSAGVLLGVIPLLAMQYYSDRAALFPMVLWYLVVGRAVAGLIVGPGVPAARAAGVALVIGLILTSILENGRAVSRMARYKSTNEAVTSALRAAGVRESRQVFSTHLSYHLGDDPSGGLFYYHSSWLQLDPNYRREFPYPDFTDLPSFEAFLDRHGIRFVVLGELTQQFSPDLKARMEQGDLGPRFRFLGHWGDVWVYAFDPSR